MDRPTTRKDADARNTRIALPEAAAFLPPSRQAVLDRGLAALGIGPILITGDAGIGKTWLVGRLIRQVVGCRWVTVDLTPSDGPAELYRHLARGLGISPVGVGRLEVAEAIAERATDDERLSLVIDEAHNLAPAVWEEVRVLANRLGQLDGFHHLVLVGQTMLVRQFATRALAAVEARLAAHLHLRPINLAEAGEWLDQRHPGQDRRADELEAIHRDTGGNPARLLRYSVAMTTRPQPRIAAAPVADRAIDAPAPAVASADSDLDDFAPATMIAARPSVAPASRPPLHVEDNAIEVGWSTDEDAPGTLDDEDAIDLEGLGGIAPRFEASDQAVHDHYAALQAWREWADNQERRNLPAKSDRDLADEIDEAAEAEAAEVIVPPPLDRGSVRVEGHQHFAPFGQLFARMAQPREPETPRS